METFADVLRRTAFRSHGKLDQAQVFFYDLKLIGSS